MKTLRCVRCDKVQKSGSFCLDCGQSLVEVVTSNIEFTPIKTKRSSEAIKRDVRKWLTRIGCQQSEIVILRDGNSAELTYSLNGMEYCFSSYRQNNFSNNLAAVEQFVHARVLGIERGIESVEQAFKGYEALPSPEEVVRGLSDAQLKQELKLHHPDTGDGNIERFEFFQRERSRRKVTE